MSPAYHSLGLDRNETATRRINSWPKYTNKPLCETRDNTVSRCWVKMGQGAPCHIQIYSLSKTCCLCHSSRAPHVYAEHAYTVSSGDFPLCVANLLSIYDVVVCVGCLAGTPRNTRSNAFTATWLEGPFCPCWRNKSQTLSDFIILYEVYHAYYDRGSIFRVKCFLNDGAP